jgi:outer membrane protein assembly factor BamB
MSLPCDGVFRQVAAEPFVAGDRVHVGGESVFSGGPQPTRPPSYAASTAAFAIRTGEPAGRLAIGRLDALRGDVVVGTDGYVTGTYPTSRIVQHGVIARLDGTQRRVLPTGALVGRATLGTDTLYVSGEAVTAYPVSGPQSGCGPDGTTECPLWSTPLDGAAGGPPVLGDGGATLYVGTAAGTVYALDTATGAVSWTAAVGSAVTGAPALAGGTLFVPTASGDLVALDAGCGTATCTPLWSAATGSTIAWQPTVAGGVAFTASGDGTLRAFDTAGCGAATCPALWSASTGSTVTGAPAVSGGRLYAGTADGRLIAYGLP